MSVVYLSEEDFLGDRPISADSVSILYHIRYGHVAGKCVMDCPLKEEEEEEDGATMPPPKLQLAFLPPTPPDTPDLKSPQTARDEELMIDPELQVLSRSGRGRSIIRWLSRRYPGRGLEFTMTQGACGKKPMRLRCVFCRCEKDNFYRGLRTDDPGVMNSVRATPDRFVDHPEEMVHICGYPHNEKSRVSHLLASRVSLEGAFARRLKREHGMRKLEEEEEKERREKEQRREKACRVFHHYDDDYEEEEVSDGDDDDFSPDYVPV